MFYIDKRRVTVERVANFYKVSKERFTKDIVDEFGMSLEEANDIYDGLKLPKRATSGSAGYDFYTPVDFVLEPGETIKIPTGIRAKMNNGWVLMIFPRSGLGFKYRLQLNNTVGVIDSDYYGSDNEGHIFIKITNDSNEGKVISLKSGDGFAQGVFLPFGITDDDQQDAVRNGGFGSTSNA